MDIQAEKLDIIQWLAKVNDINVIRQLMFVKKSSEDMASISLSSTEKDAVAKGLEDIKEGRFKSHDEVMKATTIKYSDLFK